VHRFLLVLAFFLGACPAAQARPAPKLRACMATCRTAKGDCRARVNARVAELRASCTGSGAQRRRCLLDALTANVEGKRDCKHFVRDVCVPCCKQGGTDCTAQCGNGAVEGGEECDPPGALNGCAAGTVCGPDCRCDSDTTFAEQVIRIQMKMGIVGTRLQAWLAAGRKPHVKFKRFDLVRYLTSGDLTKAEASVDRLFDIIVGKTPSSEAATIPALATRIVGLYYPIERWTASGGDLNKVAPLWAQLGGSLMSGSLTDVGTQIDKVEAFVAIPALCGTTTGTPSPPPTTSPTLIGTLVASSKNTVPGPVGFHHLMDLVTGAGVNFFLFGSHWANLEPSPGTFDFGGSLVQPLTDMLAGYPQFGGFGLIIDVINGNSRLTPADLDNLPFDDPNVLGRFEALIDALAAEPLSGKLGYILVGNEVDSLLTDPAAAAAFVTFYKRAVNRIHLKLPKVKVSVIVSSGGATERTPKLFAALSALSDFVTYTYYPIAGSATGTWLVRPTNEVKSDVDWLAALACGKPFAFAEIGYSSSIGLGSSESQQADFVRTVFADLDTYRQQGRLAFLYYASLYDLPPDTCDFPVYTLPSNAVAASICNYLRTLGLRAWDTDVPRQAWDAFGEAIDRWTRCPPPALCAP
jgi:hypothetical protein